MGNSGRHCTKRNVFGRGRETTQRGKPDLIDQRAKLLKAKPRRQVVEHRSEILKVLVHSTPAERYSRRMIQSRAACTPIKRPLYWLMWQDNTRPGIPLNNTTSSELRELCRTKSTRVVLAFYNRLMSLMFLFSWWTTLC